MNKCVLSSAPDPTEAELVTGLLLDSGIWERISETRVIISVQGFGRKRTYFIRISYLQTFRHVSSCPTFCVTHEIELS